MRSKIDVEMTEFNFLMVHNPRSLARWGMSKEMPILYLVGTLVSSYLKGVHTGDDALHHEGEHLPDLRSGP